MKLTGHHVCTACAKYTVHAGVRLDVDAERAEEQELEKGGLADTLKEIVGRTMPSPRYVRFHEAHVQRYLSRLKAFPPRCGSPCAVIWPVTPSAACCECICIESFSGVRQSGDI